ncbi:MAG: DMT family transporter [Planctomycetaceae bacterium]|nr:MAG: DMT family transporter [Planctomycetaceae bacterium]
MSGTATRPVSRWTAILMLVSVNLLWGLSFPLTKTINLQVDEQFSILAEDSSTPLRLSAAAWLIFCRFLTAFTLFAIFFRPLFRRAGRAEWVAGTYIGAFFVIGLVLQIIALATIPASRSGFLTSLVAVFTPLLTAILWRQKPRFPVLLGVAVALLGVAVLTGLVEISGGGIHMAAGAWQAWTPGDSLTTLGAVFFAGQIMLVDHYGRRLDAAALTPGMFASTAAFALVIFLVARPFVTETPVGGWLVMSARPDFWTLILALSVFSSVLAFNWMNTYQHYVSASQAGIIYTLEPVCAAGAAMVLPGVLSRLFSVEYENERIVLPMLVGGGLIIVANLLSLWPHSRNRKPNAPAESGHPVPVHQSTGEDVDETDRTPPFGGDEKSPSVAIPDGGT